MKKTIAILLACLTLLTLGAGCQPNAPALQPAMEAREGMTTPSPSNTTPMGTQPIDTTEIVTTPPTTPAATTPAATTPAPTTPAPTTLETITPMPTTPAPTTPEPTTPAPTTPEHHHSYAASQTAPTCAAKGYTKYTCPCGHSYKADYVDALGHSYTSQIVEPTTTAQGYTEHTCGVCGHSYKDNYTDKLLVECKTHDFWHTTVYKNCQEDGYREHTCLVCGYSYRDEYDAHSPDDHWYNVDNPDEVVKATYDAPGYEKYKCVFCDYVYTRVLEQLEKIDTAALESYGRHYASSTYGYKSDSSLHAGNSGYYPGIYVVINTMEQGKEHVRGCVDAQYQNDKGSGLDIWGYKENGEIWRAELNVYVQPTGDPHVFIIWVYYR